MGESRRFCDITIPYVADSATARPALSRNLRQPEAGCRGICNNPSDSGGGGPPGDGLDRVLATWKPLLPERTILLEDVSKLAETVISTIQVTEGASAADVAASWSGSTAVVVANALRGLPSRAAGTGLRRL